MRCPSPRSGWGSAVQQLLPQLSQLPQPSGKRAGDLIGRPGVDRVHVHPGQLGGRLAHRRHDVAQRVAGAVHGGGRRTAARCSAAPVRLVGSTSIRLTVSSPRPGRPRPAGTLTRASLTWPLRASRCAARLAAVVSARSPRRRSWTSTTACTPTTSYCSSASMITCCTDRNAAPPRQPAPNWAATAPQKPERAELLPAPPPPASQQTGTRSAETPQAGGHPDELNSDAPAPGPADAPPEKPLDAQTGQPTARATAPQQPALERCVVLHQGVNQHLLPPSEAPGQPPPPIGLGRYRPNIQRSALRLVGQHRPSFPG